KVISRSTFDLQTVLDALVESAARLCDSEMALIARQRGSGYSFAATFGFPEDFAGEAKEIRLESGRASIIGRVLMEGSTVQIPDVLADPDYELKELQRRIGYRTCLGVPLLREGRPIGVLVVGGKAVRPFTDKQIELVTTFADQAVIAIENVRLFEAEQERTRELAESLEQQTATSEVLRVISSSPGELEPVFQAMLANATRICDARFGSLIRFEAGAARIVSRLGIPPAFAAWQDSGVHRPGPLNPIIRLARTRETVHIL